jgi:hypothetical protein
MGIYLAETFHILYPFSKGKTEIRNFNAKQHIGIESRTQFINPINKSTPSRSQRERVRAMAIKGRCS